MPTASLPDSAGKWGINREELKAAASTYIEDLTWLHDRALDWLLANMLAYAEIDAFLLHVNKHLHFNYSKKALWGALAAKAAWGLLKWAIWIAVVAALFTLGKWFGILLIAFTAIVQIIKHLRRRRLAKLTMAMIDVYSSLSSPTLSWSVVWDLMKTSRALGAVWDPQLYKLVEDRMRSPSGR